MRLNFVLYFLIGISPGGFCLFTLFIKYVRQGSPCLGGVRELCVFLQNSAPINRSGADRGGLTNNNRCEKSNLFNDIFNKIYNS